MTPWGRVGVKPSSPALSLSITWQHSQTIEKMLHCHLQPLWDQFGGELASRNMADLPPPTLQLAPSALGDRKVPATLVRLNKPPNMAAECGTRSEFLKARREVSSSSSISAAATVPTERGHAAIKHFQRFCLNPHIQRTLAPFSGASPHRQHPTTGRRGETAPVWVRRKSRHAFDYVVWLGFQSISSKWKVCFPPHLRS